MLITTVTRDLVCHAIDARQADTHKGSYGKALIISGSAKYAGAPFFASQAAVNSGSGLVFLAHPECLHGILAGKLNEPILFPQMQDDNMQISTRAADRLCEELSRFDVCLAGPGMGRGRGTARCVKNLLRYAECPLVLDADALNELASDVDMLKAAHTDVIITPHEGEFKRLYPAFDREMRAEHALAFSQEYGCITVLKGHRTVVAAPSGRVYVNTTGNPGMAKGGSGDVLAGMITSLLGQGIESEKAAYIGVWLHGRAGDICAERLGEYGMTPTDMLGDIKLALREAVKS